MTLSDYVLEQSKSKFTSQPNTANMELPFAEFLVNQFTDAAVCLGPDTRLLYVNDAACRMTGYSREELLSMTLYDIDPDLSSRVWSERWRSLKQQGRLTLESQCQTKVGRIVSVKITLTHAEYNDRELACALIHHQPSQAPLLKDSTELTDVDELGQEISELRGREAELEQSISLLNATLESTANGVVAVSFDGEILSVNQKFRDVWGIPDSVILSRKCARCKAFFESQFKDPEAFLRLVWEVSSQSDFESYDVFELMDGRIFAHYSKPQRLNGTIVGRVWSVWDVTESKRTEEALRLSEARFRALAETTDTIIFVIQAGRLCYVNPATATLTGYNKAELLDGFDLRQLIKSRSEPHKPDKAAPKYQEMRILTKRGMERWLACSVELLNGELDFARKPIELVTAIDITNYKQAEAEVHRALEQAKQLSELRARFVSMVCHQLHTPLNVISYSTSLLRRHVDQWTGERKRLYFDYIQTAIEQISQLLNEMLLFGKAEAAKLRFEPKPFDLNLFCNELVAQMQIVSSQNTINFTSQGTYSTAHIDKNLLQPILTNLLSNATKYSTSGGTVDLSLSCQDRQVIFQIKDVGIGIPAADQRQLFEPFYRGSNVGELPGNGLGLSIVKMLVDLHEGQIAVASEVGIGTTFTVTLPLVSQ